MNYSEKRLIEEFLPIQAIITEASWEESVRKGHISTLHLWWARKPLLAVFKALVLAERFFEIPDEAIENTRVQRKLNV